MLTDSATGPRMFLARRERRTSHLLKSDFPSCCRERPFRYVQPREIVRPGGRLRLRGASTFRTQRRSDTVGKLVKAGSRSLLQERPIKRVVPRAAAGDRAGNREKPSPNRRGANPVPRFRAKAAVVAWWRPTDHHRCSVAWAAIRCFFGGFFWRQHGSFPFRPRLHFRQSAAVRHRHRHRQLEPPVPLPVLIVQHHLSTSSSPRFDFESTSSSSSTSQADSSTSGSALNSPAFLRQFSGSSSDGVPSRRLGAVGGRRPVRIHIAVARRRQSKCRPKAFPGGNMAVRRAAFATAA